MVIILIVVVGFMGNTSKLIKFKYAVILCQIYLNRKTEKKIQDTKTNPTTLARPIYPLLNVIYLTHQLTIGTLISTKVSLI